MEFIELFKAQGFELLIPVVVALFVQAVKRTMAFENDAWYIVLGVVFSAALALLKAYGLQAWNDAAYNAIIYSLSSVGVWSYGRRIPVLKVFFEDKDETT